MPERAGGVKKRWSGTDPLGGGETRITETRRV